MLRISSNRANLLGWGIAIVLMGASLPSSARDCPIDGSARSPKVRALNYLKNRTAIPSTSDIDSTVTLKGMLTPGSDRSRWSTKHAAVVEGYVANVIVGGIETVNCGANDPADRDTHIELTLDPMNDDERKHVIVEVTPRVRDEMQRQGKNWSTKALRSQLLGRWVRVTGWLLFDAEHEGQSLNTAGPRARKIWRATAWEIHPITAIEVLPGKPKAG